MPAFIWLTVMTALRILARNRLRAGLTMLGIVIGVGAVIAMVSIGEGAKRAVQAQIATMGTNVIIVWPGATTRLHPPKHFQRRARRPRRGRDPHRLGCVGSQEKDSVAVGDGMGKARSHADGQREPELEWSD